MVLSRVWAPINRRRWVAAVALSALLSACAPLLPADAPDPLPSWNAGPNKERIVDFVAAVTTVGGKDYVPPGDRIAVFDMDGTLWLEYPQYTQIRFVFDRIRELAPQHPEWKEKQPYKSVLAGDMAGVMAAGENGLYEMVLVAQSATTTEAFIESAKQWIAASKDERFGRPYSELVYEPMLEVLRYLRANGFKNYIVSGDSVDFMRGFSDAIFGVPNEQVIGTRQKLAFEILNGKPQIVMLPELESDNDRRGKAINIAAIIGKRPIAAFGNSDGDFQMLQWTTSGPGARLGMLVHHDDAVREYAYDRDTPVGRLAQGLDKHQAMGWGLVSMKNDWKLVFPSRK